METIDSWVPQHDKTLRWGEGEAGGKRRDGRSMSGGHAGPGWLARSTIKTTGTAVGL